MQSMTHSRIAAIGVAALLSTSCLVAADTPTLTSTWDAATTSKNDDVTIKIAGKIQAVGFGYVEMRRVADRLGDKFEEVAYGNDHEHTRPAVSKKEKGAKDGFGLEDAEITFSGTAYKHVTFGMRYDIGNSSDISGTTDKNYIKLDKWWVGLTALPYLGEITIREVDEHMGFILSESWLEETMTHNAFYGNGFRPMVGVKWAKTISNTGVPMIDDRVKLWAATGVIANEIGATDKDWSFNGSFCWDVVKETDNTNVSVKVDASRENLRGTNADAYEVNAFMYAGKTSKLSLGKFAAAAEAVNIYCAAVSTTHRNLGLIGEYYLADGDAPNGQRDFKISGWTVAGAIALTGENELGNLGIKKPAKALKGDNILENCGAFELVARVSALNASDKKFKGTDRSNAHADNLGNGLDAMEYQLGLNWYPTGNMLVGLMGALNTWEKNSLTHENVNELTMFGLRTMVKF